jgi:hypothetical protein
MLVRALKAGVVVHLRVAGTPHLPPMRDHTVERGRGGRVRQRPGAGPATVERHGGEHIEHRAVGELQHLDEVEEIELHRAGAHAREMPAGGRRWVPLALPPVDLPMAHEDPANRPHAGHGAAVR